MSINWLLIVVLAIFITCVIIGWKKGFVRVIFSLFATIVALTLTLILSPVTTAILKSQDGLYDKIYEGVDDFIDLNAAYDKLVDSGLSADATLREKVEAMMEGIGLPSAIRKSMTGSSWFTDFAEGAGSELKEKELVDLEAAICANLCTTIINALGFVITLILVVIALFVIGKFLDLITKLPLIKQVNAGLGIAAGALQGLLFVWILFTVITMFGATEFGQTLLGMITRNSFLQFLYEKNLIALKFFS